MFGKLTFSAIPYHEPIIMFTYMIIIIVSVLIFCSITYMGKWKYLWKNWITTLDHKKIAIMYMILGLVMLIRGFIDALMMRMQQYVASIENSNINLLPAHHYNQIFTVHGVIMIFFVAMPLIIALMNFIVPLQIGARDLAFPFLNNLSFWLTVSGALLINISLGIGEFSEAGWLAYPPLSEVQYSPGVGVDYWIWSLQISGIGTILTGINFLVTILKMRTPGMTMFKMPVFTWTVFCSNVLIVAAFPVLAITLIFLTLDRYLGFHFFTNDFGGNAMMYVNLIWIWGHPEVYILILPAFGVFSEVVATFSKKSLFGYISLVWATIVITILSFIVWMHHFFTMGASSNVNAFFGITTMIIAIPTGVKIFNWLFTMYQGKIFMHPSMLWTVGFLITFSIGGMAGVLLSLPPIDFLLHNSLFLVAHFHNVIIGGVVFGYFAAINYWFPKIFGFYLDEKWGKISFWFWIIGFFIAFMPLYFLGLMGMTRRISQGIDSEFHFLLTIAVFGSVLIALGIISQVVQLIVSLKKRKFNLDITGDPWDGRTLEWSTVSPPPFYNFAVLPKVHSIDEFWKIKQNGMDVKMLNLGNYTGFHVPKNTGIGFFIGIFSTLFGFSAVWNIWWLCIMTLNIILLFWIFRVLDTDVEVFISAQQVKEIEENIKK